MGARPSPVIDAGEQLDSRKVRGHGLLCEHRSALRAPRISPSTERHRSHAQGTGRWSGSRYIAIKYLLKLNYFLKRSIAQLNHKLRTPICCVATIFVAACYTKVYSSRSFTEDGPRMI